jgi:methylphosphotriester-DNA--protein-cysteine methyltransferase
LRHQPTQAEQGGVVGIRFFRPCAPLAGVVSRIYAHDSGPIELGNLRWLIVPDGEIKLIFPARGDICCTIGDTGRLHRAGRLILSGMRTSPGYLAFPEGVDAIGVIIKPEAAYRLIDVPHDEITNCTLDAEEVFGAAARRCQQQLSNASCVEERVAAIQRELSVWLARRPQREPEFEWAVRRLAQHGGWLRIDKLAHEIGWSRRHLERRFQERVGIAPKSLASVLRFHAVYKRMRSTPGSYGRLIHANYYDQPHFLKDFKRYAGMSPRAYAAATDYGKLYIPS